jgi:DNA-binding NtrC family response regulator
MNSILLIEDDRSWANMFATFAARVMGVEVMVAAGIEGAEALLHTHSFDVVVLDLTLEDATPSGSLAAIKHLGKYAPVVVVTGATGEKAGKFRNLAIFNGASSFIQKEHLQLGGAWYIAMSTILDAYLREKRAQKQEAA